MINLWRIILTTSKPNLNNKKKNILMSNHLILIGLSLIFAIFQGTASKFYKVFDQIGCNAQCVDTLITDQTFECASMSKTFTSTDNLAHCKRTWNRDLIDSLVPSSGLSQISFIADIQLQQFCGPSAANLSFVKAT